MSANVQPLVQVGATQQEQTFLNENGVLVTNARLNVPGQMYAMANVSSVGIKHVPPKRGGAIFLVLLGIFTMPVTYGIPLIAGILWLALAKSTSWVILRTSGGEMQALQSKDRAFIERVVAALGNAIISRG